MKIDYCNCGMGVRALDIINTGMNVINTGVNVYSATKDTTSHTSHPPSSNVTVVNERQLTDQEIELLKDKHQQWVRSQELDRALKMQQSADFRRLLDNEFRPNHTQDHTTTYIVAGLLFFGLVVAFVKK